MLLNPAKRSSFLPPLRFLLVFLAAGLFGSCAVTDFVGAYFNTYYNAQRVFGEAESEVLTAAQSPGRQAEKPFLAPFEVQSTAKTKFTSVIEKCSKLLQYHPDSKLVDDALLMIGKCYYYQNEHQSAERKFKELISTHPSSGLVLETRLLLANTYYRMNDKAAAVSTAKELVGLASEEKEDDIVAQASFLLGQIEFENKNYPAALEYFRVAAEGGPTSEDRSSAYRKVADMYRQQGEYTKAADTYQQAEAASSDYVGRYRARIGYARMLSMAGQNEVSLRVLEDMLSNSNNRDFFGEIDLEIANVYRAQKDYTSALAQYRYVDSTYARSEVSASSYYESGILYEKKLMQFDSARVAYSKGRTEFPQAAITPQLIQRSDYMNKYFVFTTEMAKNDSLKKAILAPRDTLVAKHDTTSGDSTGGRPLVKRDTSATDTSLAKAMAPKDTLRPKAPVVPSIPLDTIEARLAAGKTELATLFYTGIGLVDSAKYWYLRVLDEHPRSEHVPRALFILSQIYSQDSTVNASVVDSLRQEVIRRFPASEFAAESRKLMGLPPLAKEVDPVDASYARGEQLMREGKQAAAIDTFKSLVSRHPTSPVASKAQFAVGWAYEQMKAESDSAISNYRRLVENFPASQYATLVRPKLQEVEAKFMREKAVRDSIRIKQEELQKQAAKDTLRPSPLPENVKGSVPDSLNKGGVADTLKKVVPDEPLAPPKQEDEGAKKEMPQ